MTVLGQMIRSEMERGRRQYLDALPLDRLRELWDTLPDDGSAHIDPKSGMIYDCDDIHAALNRRGDGAYCAV